MLATNLKSCVTAELNKVDKLIVSSLHSEIPLVQDIGKYIVKGGGKRLRPTLLLICAKACGYKGLADVNMATVIEYIHTATLLHDDVVDDSLHRREAKTANNVWGNQAAVLVGDFLYSRAFQMMVEVGNTKILKVVADATNIIAQGEVLQLVNQHNKAITEHTYLQIIRNKTAKLFEAAAEIGAILADSEIHIQSSVAQFGLHLGTAYQLVDDILDYENDQLAGSPSMPKAFNFEFASREIALAKQAISELPASEYKNAALELADFVLARTN